MYDKCIFKMRYIRGLMISIEVAECLIAHRNIMFASLWLVIVRLGAYFTCPIPGVEDDCEMPHLHVWLFSHACSSLVDSPDSFSSQSNL